MKNEIVSSENVIGVKVKNTQGEDLGHIEALMLDKIKGCVVYVVLSFGGFLGMGDKLFAMPWSIFSYDKEDECFVIDMDKEKLKHSPGFDKDNWPNMNDPAWASTIHQHYHSSRAPMSNENY